MERVFYCNPCGEEQGWPWRIEKLNGRCQVCGEECLGNQTPIVMLPLPPEIKGQLRFKFEKGERWNGY